MDAPYDLTKDGFHIGKNLAVDYICEVVSETNYYFGPIKDQSQ